MIYLSRHVFSTQYHNIPCYADFVRYILWHNHAIQTIQNLGLDSMTLHYESYSIGHNRTTNRILNFLGLNFTYKPEEFQRGKGYRDHFKPDEIAAVKSLAEEISDDETWELLERYFWLAWSKNCIEQISTKQKKSYCSWIAVESAQIIAMEA